MVTFSSGKRIPVVVKRVLLSDVVAPTVRTFFAMPGASTVHVERAVSPLFPAENNSRFSGFCAEKKPGSTTSVRFVSSTGQWDV